jgi:serine acetyltransferase
MANLSEGQTISVGTVLGSEGTDGGMYAPHCDFEVTTALTKISDTKINTGHNTRIDASTVVSKGVAEMNKRSETDPQYADYKNVQFKHGQKHTPA